MNTEIQISILNYNYHSNNFFNHVIMTWSYDYKAIKHVLVIKV